ncbi:hypothetical protein G7085_04910 [Tessaracoccus sp. HDW20]|uniref:hypothetical protein n=1 Tax=Tessaracoccus coleopterorum TaxID=2714950 RepID=UPI0018D45513|nr:hypothetical protein [Tessaracoccus coleopterorum]NHB84183.1 hypothetical protein [Tessaracoccus coleopterorum]
MTVIATGTVTFSALFAGTATGLAADIAAVRQAAALRVGLEEPADPQPSALPALAEVPGVTAAVPVWREDRAQVGDLLVPLVAAPLDSLADVTRLPSGTELPDGLTSGAPGASALRPGWSWRWTSTWRCGSTRGRPRASRSTRGRSSPTPRPRAWMASS